MKSKIVGLVAVFALAITASADVFYWQVPEASISGANDPSGGSASSDISWTYAMLRYTTTDNESDATGPSLDAAAGGTGDFNTYWRQYSIGTSADSGIAGEGVASDIAGSPSARYYIALYDSSDKLVGYSSYLNTVANLQDFTAASRNIANWDTANFATGSGYTAAPEPTSGVLLLLGAAVLGLRRRKVA